MAHLMSAETNAETERERVKNNRTVVCGNKQNKHLFKKHRKITTEKIEIV